MNLSKNRENTIICWRYKFKIQNTFFNEKLWKVSDLWYKVSMNLTKKFYKKLVKRGKKYGTNGIRSKNIEHRQRRTYK